MDIKAFVGIELSAGGYDCRASGKGQRHHLQYIQSILPKYVQT